jgi:hypothetical protein
VPGLCQELLKAVLQHQQCCTTVYGSKYLSQQQVLVPSKPMQHLASHWLVLDLTVNAAQCRHAVSACTAVIMSHVASRQSLACFLDHFITAMVSVQTGNRAQQQCLQRHLLQPHAAPSS